MWWLGAVSFGRNECPPSLILQLELIIPYNNIIHFQESFWIEISLNSFMIVSAAFHLIPWQMKEYFSFSSRLMHYQVVLDIRL